MPPIELIYPYYCYKSCQYDNGLVDGYLLGLATMMLAAMVWVCYIAVTEDFEDDKSTDNKKND
jgi:hypothetical protein